MVQQIKYAFVFREYILKYTIRERYKFVIPFGVQIIKRSIFTDTDIAQMFFHWLHKYK